MPISKKISYETSPGEMYKGITSVSEPFEGETKTTVEKNPDFVIYCKRMAKQFPGLGKGAVFSDQHKEAIDFLGWRLSAEEFMCAIKGTFIIGIIPAIIILVILFFVAFSLQIGNFSLGLDLFSTVLGGINSDFHPMIFMIIAIALFGIIGAVIYMIYNYPINMADDEKNKALTYVPEMVGYLIMSMKLVPNLEKAIEFSAKHGKGKVAEDFQRLIWDFQIGVYSSISEGLDMMAVHWGKYSTELKEALMRIRSSVMEPSESKRYQILDKTMMEVLDSVKEKMGDYARGLNQPSVMLFYIGVLLPLLLIIILPVGAAFTAMPIANPFVIIFLYCFLIPFIAFSFAKSVVKKRPPTYEPPIIKDDFVGLPRKWAMKVKGGSIDSRLIFVIILAVGIGASFFLSAEGLPPKSLFTQLPDGSYDMPFQVIPSDKQWNDVYKDKGPNYFEKVVLDLYFIQITDPAKGDYYLSLVNSNQYTPEQATNVVLSEKLMYTSSPSKDPTKYIFWAGAILSIVGGASFLLFQRVKYKREAQLGIIQMEDEFKESMYMIASRMGENKPVESALKQAKDYLPNLMISKRIFGKTIENIELMGLPLESAVFDPVYGAMKGIPSKILITAMRLLVDSVNLGVEVASRTLMSLSMQMENMDKVNKALQEMVSDVTTTMQTMAIFIAPVVLGITTALQKVVVMTLSQVVSSPEITNSGTDATSALGGAGLPSMGSFFKVDLQAFASLATPLEYMIIIGIYVVMIVIILTYFTTKIKEDNDLVFKENLAKALPIAMAVYLITTLVSNFAISSMMP